LGEQLPEEKLNRILPVLSSLAKYIGTGNMPSRHALEELLYAVGMEGEEWAIEELELWGKILEQARTASNDDERTDVAAELQNRGIPMAPAILAVDAAIPPPLIVEPQSINFGCLKPSEGANATLKVSGQLLKVTVRNSRLKVTLLNLGSGNSLVKVQLLAGSAGESLQDNILLQGERGELKLPVAARWEKVETERPLLSYCPLCRDEIKKKSLFWNRYARRYECFYCKAEGPSLDKLIRPKSHH